jgi:acyl-CoA reductase-like NAD-dependent aldehyde dehydrogenase
MSTTTLDTQRATALAAAFDPVVARLASRKDAWVRVDLPERIALLRRTISGVLHVCDEWVRAGCAAKGLDPRSPAAGEEWISGPMTTVRMLRLLAQALEHGGAPPPLWTKERANGQIVARVFPMTWLEHAVYSGMCVDVWIQPDRPASQGAIYREKRAGQLRPGRVCCVLGAGNVSSIGPLDVLYQLFTEDEVVVLKLNPVNDYFAPIFTQAFAPLIEPGYLQIVSGGADVGEYLCQHAEVDSIHLTGSDRTHDAIVWGTTPAEQAWRKAAGTPRILKRVTSELGCVTPVLVVPGRWSASSLAYHARNVASMLTHNASFNCNAAKVLVLARGWSQRQAFLDSLHETLERLPSRRAYYPGAEQRYAAFREHYPNAHAFGQPDTTTVPWTILPNVPPVAGEYALTREAFCGVLAEVSLDVTDARSFLHEAVAFANEHVWGTLSCALIIDPRTRRAHPNEFERALEGLRYGDIGVNVWTGANFALGEPSWGAYPGGRLDDIGSGIGVVHNAMLFDYPQKSIVTGPFRMFPTPVWFTDHRTLHTLGRLATFFEASPSWARLPKVAWTGMRG